MFGTLLCHSPWIINHIYDPFMLKKKELRPKSEEDHYLLLVEGGVLLTCVYRILCTQHPPPPPAKKRDIFSNHILPRSHVPPKKYASITN